LSVFLLLWLMRLVVSEGVQMTAIRLGIALLAGLAILHAIPVGAQQANMTFFVTSVGMGKGADLGGLVGADHHCQELAASVGAGNKTWHAYLSTQGSGAVNARDRIGKGPWMNAKGVVIAKDVAELHGANNLTKQTALTDKGEVNNGIGDKPNRHDILTGSKPDGTAFPSANDMTCKNWTSTRMELSRPTRARSVYQLAVTRKFLRQLNAPLLLRSAYAVTPFSGNKEFSPATNSARWAVNQVP
jgi:hypothetical protein